MILRFGQRALVLVAFTLFCIVPHLASRRFAKASRWPQRFLAGAARIGGMDVRVVGRPLGADVFYIANHVSWMDILVLGGATGCAFVSRDDVGRWPVIGWLAAQNNTILVSRSGRAEVEGQIATIRAAMASHQPVALFPEGTTGDGVTLLPFKAALFAVLLPPPRALRVQPVFVDYGPSAPHMGWTGDEGAFANARRILGRKGRTPVTLHFLDPFDPGAHPDRKALAAEARGRLDAAMRSLRGDAGAV